MKRLPCKTFQDIDAVFWQLFYIACYSQYGQIKRINMMDNYKFNFSTKNISDEEFEIVKENYYSEMKKLYEIMPTLTWDEYRKQFSEISNKLHENSGQNILLPNTTWIEIREFEVFDKRWSDYIDVLK
jgi:hypothetical protein